MPALSDYTAGTITLTNGSTAFTGAGTGWQAADFREGDTILGIEANGGDQYVVEAITGNAAGTLTQPWEGASGTYTYRMRYLADGARVTAQARELIELLGNGNLQALAGLTGPGVPVFNGPHAMVIRPETDFINGVAYDVQVDTLADRAAYDGQTAGFAVLVSDVGDGRSALYAKVTNTSGDWSDAAYVTGPVGPAAEVTVGTTATLPPGSGATVTPTPVPGGIELDFGIPAGEGFSFVPGGYNPATEYVKGDVALYNDSSWIALQATTGNAPPVLPVTENAYWSLLAAAGVDGTGTGDMVGPAGAVDGNLVVFDGPTGKLTEDSGVSTADLVLSANLVWLSKGIGELYAVDTSMAGVNIPPTDNALFRYALLTAGESGVGEYNEGILTSESVTGTGPLLQATAIISLSGSPVDSSTIRLINSERRVLRAGSPGAVESDALQGSKIEFGSGGTAKGDALMNSDGSAYPVIWGAPGGTTRQTAIQTIVSDGTNGTPRIANETRAKSLGITYYMRIK